MWLCCFSGCVAAVLCWCVVVKFCFCFVFVFLLFGMSPREIGLCGPPPLMRGSTTTTTPQGPWDSATPTDDFDGRVKKVVAVLFQWLCCCCAVLVCCCEVLFLFCVCVSVVWDVPQGNWALRPPTADEGQHHHHHPQGPWGSATPTDVRLYFVCFRQLLILFSLSTIINKNPKP